MAAATVILTRLESPPEMSLISNDNAFLNDLGGDGGNNFDQRTLFARFDCGDGGDVSMFVQKPVFNAVALFGLLGNETFELESVRADSPFAILATRRIGADFRVVTILAAKGSAATTASEQPVRFRLPTGTETRLERKMKSRTPSLPSIS